MAQQSDALVRDALTSRFTAVLHVPYFRGREKKGKNNTDSNQDSSAIYLPRYDTCIIVFLSHLQFSRVPVAERRSKLVIVHSGHVLEYVVHLPKESHSGWLGERTCKSSGCGACLDGWHGLETIFSSCTVHVVVLTGGTGFFIKFWTRSSSEQVNDTSTFRPKSK